MTPEILKVIVLLVLFLLTFLLGVIPIKVFEKLRERARTRNASSGSLQAVIDGRPRNVRKPFYRRVMSLMSCYAAGVFLATCILDLLPDVRHQLIRVLFSMSIFTGFPVAEFVTSFGFFVLLIIEQFVLMMKETQLRRSGERKPLLSEHKASCREEDDKSLTESISGISDRPITPEEDIADPLDHHHHHHHHGLEEDDEHHHSVLRSLVLLLALSLHSVFEGLAVGLQRDAQQVLQIFAALVLHKSILSFSLGMNLVQSQLKHRAIIQSILLFSITSPIGIGIGIGIVDLWDSIWSSLIQGILQGLACGTFLYVTFFEVLPHEFNTRDDRILKLLFLLLGYITITGIMFLDSDIGKPFCAIGSLNDP